MTFREAVSKARLELADLEDPGLEARLLMMHLTNWKPHQLALSMDDPAGDDLLRRYFALVDRRKRREPLQHITGTVDFMGREFLAAPEALIPRPETEMLVKLFIERLDDPRLLLDVGTGSGVIAATLALHYPDAMVVASDVSLQALKLAERNLAKHNIENVQLVQSDLLKNFCSNVEQADGIVANLPYVKSKDIPKLQPEVSRGDPALALDGGIDGLRLILPLIDSAPGLLKEKGILMLEIGADQQKEVMSALLSENHWRSVVCRKDVAGRPRYICAENKTENKIPRMGT
ncbi:MAG: peptide chain release factor N(5)-glutamine methyltransferase [Candidatus Aegiribacteria sp.]|nr:peptide chain release factor N(5)-glutamine methyltransferase [Candidatus Aegiribacteria sp.]MBD3293915.1 peptide chain release factor N(5)-glutamine methyltransferase [Candidatus Fermentibacteria bacterium]